MAAKHYFYPTPNRRSQQVHLASNGSTAERLILIAIYAKTERVDIQAEHIRYMIEEYGQSLME